MQEIKELCSRYPEFRPSGDIVVKLDSIKDLSFEPTDAVVFEGWLILVHPENSPVAYNLKE